MKIKKIFALLLVISIMTTLFVGCSDSSTEKEDKVTLKIACFAPDDSKLFNDKDLQGAFQKEHPNVNIEVEEYKDAAEYNNAMKIRASANQLPDVMYMKTYMFSDYKDYLSDLTELESTDNNLFSKDYRIDDKVYGLPTVSGKSYVYYWTDMFEEAGVEVPKTWNEFADVAKTLKDFYSKNDPNFIALGVGAKDEWPTYPYMEFMPAAESGNGALWNEIATQDEPFAEGTDISKTYHKVYDLFTSGVCGKDPLGIGHDQVSSLFAEKQVGMITFAPTLLSKLQGEGRDLSTLSTFYLPVRDSEDEEFRNVIQGDNFLSISQDSANQEIAKEFINFFFSNEWYPEFINAKGDDSALSTYSKEKDPILKAADEKQPDMVNVCYDGGNKDFNDIVAQTKFNYKKLGAQFFIEGFDLDEELVRLNEAWKQARTTLNIK
ncbi:ABC transporter substrate-binding protein [Clostridium grantii]|uniref:Raffinose/stachyose/melibiose transport system substrate-binding protein n=1 Tax=Clostridium grantii DSM 8605 TaxID=1121316 RepID=A0A1M5VF50_9CLOT|nr:ABC transporter substrate-binding protein [Clostridium grantii]SHH73533.1 raffinose/stachyose/melibiose transport system substrate-binding protein [Clostridium grantii DSM 8605]